MYVPELYNSYHAMRKMLSETESAQKVDTDKRNALRTAVQALDKEISRKLVAAGLPVTLAQYQAGLVTLNELGQHFLMAYACEDKK